MFTSRVGRRRHPGGFTLVELLVVIGIIALLISILLPALNKARQQALTVQCSSQMRQLGQFLNLYANDSNGSILPASGPSGSFGQWVFPMAYIAKYKSKPPVMNYAASKEVFTAPSLKIYNRNPLMFCPVIDDMRMYYWFESQQVSTYTFVMTETVKGAFSFSAFPKITRYRQPSTKLLICELPVRVNASTGALEPYTGNPKQPYWPFYATHYNQFTSNTARYRPLEVHNKAANFVFADGHVERKQNVELTRENFYAAE